MGVVLKHFSCPPHFLRAGAASEKKLDELSEILTMNLSNEMILTCVIDDDLLLKERLK